MNSFLIIEKFKGTMPSITQKGNTEMIITALLTDEMFSKINKAFHIN